MTLATIYACTRAERLGNAPKGIRAQMGRASELRELLLTSAESLALGGFLSKVAVSKIRDVGARSISPRTAWSSPGSSR